MRQLPRHQHRNLGLIIGPVLVITLSVLAIFGPRASEARHSSVDAKTIAPATSNAATAQQQQGPRPNAPTATAVWDGGGANNNWSTAANWSPDVAPVDASDLVFPAFVPLNSLTNNNDISGLDVNSISISGGSYHLSGNAITLSNDITVFQAAATTSQIDLDISGTGTLTKLGTGTLTLTGESTLTGLTTISAGILDIGGGGPTGSIAGNTANNGVLQFNNSDGIFYSGDVSGTGSVVVADGILAFNGAFNHTGGTTINAGVTVQEQTNGSIAGNVTNNGSLSFANGALPTYAGVISGTGSLSQSVSTLTLTGANTYTGVTNILAPGVLQIGNGGTTGIVAGNITNNSNLIFNRSDAASYPGIISGPGNVTKLGAGTLTLTGANSYTGTTTVSAGALQIGNGGTIGSLVSNVVDNSNLTFDRSNAATYAGVISGTGTVTKLSANTLTLTGESTLTGLTTISAGILDIGGGGTTGSIAGNIATNAVLQFNHSTGAHYDGDTSGTGSVVILDGTLGFTGALNHTGGTTVSAGTTLQEQSNGSITGNITNNGNLSFANGALPTYAGVISGTGKLNQSVGTLTLTGANTYTGGTDITAAGVLQLGNGGTTGSVTGNITNIGTLIFNHSGGVIFAGVISGPGNVTKLGAGTLSLTGTNSYTGTTTVSAGALQIGAGGTIGSLVSDVVDNSSLIFNRSNAASYAGVISGTGTVTKLSANTLALTGANTLTGVTTINAGILDIGGGGTTGSIAGNIVNNAVLQFNHSNGAFYGGDTSGTGSVVLLDGTLAFTGALNHTGGTTISAGTTLQEQTLGSIGGNVTNNGTLSFANGNLPTYAGVISGTGTLNVVVGTLTLTGANTYTGVTNILAPGVVLVNGNNLASPVSLIGGKLGGSGTVGPITATGGTLAPGNSPGILTTNDNLSFNAAATFSVEIGGTSAGTQYDLLICLGSTANLGGANLTGSLINGFIPAPGTQFTIMSAPDGGIFSGQFAQGNSVTIGGRQFSITYNASSVVLTAEAPTAADGFVSGNIAATDGTPVSGAVISLTGSQSRKTITDANGKYQFDNVETGGFYTVTPSRSNYNFNPFSRSFSQLGNRTDAIFTGMFTGHHANPVDTPEYFVRQHYLDFLGREPDEAGFNFWSDQMLECDADADCLERRRINVSAAYFLSIEFQETGGLVDGLYRASYGRRPNYVEFVPDSSAIAQGVLVGRTGWEQELETNKAAFVDAWVERSAFHAAYDGLSNEDYVDQLVAHTGVNFTSSERDALVTGLTTGTLSRAAVLRQIVENRSFIRAKFNQTFVMMQYFGYLRRDPDESGYQFWLNKLNEFNGNFEQAEMVKAFLVSGEYRERFRR